MIKKKPQVFRPGTAKLLRKIEEYNQSDNLVTEGDW